MDRLNDGWVFKHRTWALLSCCLGLVGAGCEEDRVQVYSAPKDSPDPSVVAFLSNTDPSGQSPRDPGHGEEGHVHRDDESESSRLPEWEVPAGWEQQPATRMVLARFAVKDPALGTANVSVTAFPGDVGGMLANVNRWRREIGLPAIPETELTKVTAPTDVNGMSATVVEMVSDSAGGPSSAATRLVVVVLPRSGETWFYKLTGPDALVAREKPALLKFVQSVRYPHAA